MGFAMKILLRAFQSYGDGATPEGMGFGAP